MAEVYRPRPCREECPVGRLPLPLALSIVASRSAANWHAMHGGLVSDRRLGAAETARDDGHRQALLRKLAQCPDVIVRPRALDGGQHERRRRQKSRHTLTQALSWAGTSSARVGCKLADEGSTSSSPSSAARPGNLRPDDASRGYDATDRADRNARSLFFRHAARFSGFKCIRLAVLAGGPDRH